MQLLTEALENSVQKAMGIVFLKACPKGSFTSYLSANV